MPIYKNPKTPKSWRVVVWAKGKRHEAIVRGSKSDAETHEARMRVELAAKKSVSSRSTPKFFDFCAQEYKPHAQLHFKGKSWKGTYIYVVADLMEFFGDLKLTDITVQATEDYKRARKDLSGSTVNFRLTQLSTILKYAATLGYPTPDLRIRKLTVRGSRRVHAWTLAQVQKLYAACPSFLLPIVVFLANTGCRKGESIAAEWSWIDFRHRMIRIPSTEYWTSKNGRPREIPLADAVRTMLRAQQKRKLSERWVFPRYHGGGRYQTFPGEAFDRARDKARLKGGPHTLRHTFASLFLERCPDMFLLSQILGHSHTETTQIYSHLLPSHLERGRNVVNLSPKTVATTVGDDEEE